MKRVSALFFCLMMITMSLSGCLGGDDTDEEPDNQNPTTSGELDDWNVHFAATSGDLPACDATTLGRLYYVEDDGNFQVCNTSGWEVIDISGADGIAAAAGADGKTPMFNVTASTTCLNGGKRVAIGEDIDENGVLDAAEAIIVMDICDGESGTDGADGADGTNGIDGANALISTSAEPAGSNCANGGTRIDAGVDDDGDGTLDAAEIDQTQYVCDGGSSNNTLLSTISLPPPSMGCDAGGIVISFGLDNGDGGGIYANGVLEAGEVDTTTTYCSKYIIGMVKDISSGSDGSYPYHLTTIGSTLYFKANDSTGASENDGGELWKSDGTTAGTVMVKDINPGSDESGPNRLTAVGNTLYFSADDGTSGRELWKSDGTAAGTVMVKDIWSGSDSGYPYHLTAIGNTLYFNANDGTNGVELWKSDGTTAGTVMVKDINPGSSHGNPTLLTAIGNTLYISADDGTNGYELWKSDGTSSGTVMVKDINVGSEGSAPQQLTAIGNTLYFKADDGATPESLWRSDGTSLGTYMVYGSLWTTGSSSPDHLTAVGNTLYFKAEDGTNGEELWKSDGTNAGTVLVKDINPGSSNSAPVLNTAIGNTLYFQASDGTNGYELWKSDGTTAGTVMVKDINSGTSNGLTGVGDLTAVGNTLYFSADDGTSGRELWKSDGTTAGTVMVKDIWSGSDSSYPSELTQFGNKLYFTAYDVTTGSELFMLDIHHEITYS